MLDLRVVPSVCQKESGSYTGCCPYITTPWKKVYLLINYCTNPSTGSAVPEGPLWNVVVSFNFCQVHSLCIICLLHNNATFQICNLSLQSTKWGLMNTIHLLMQPAKNATQGLKELFILPPAHCVACSSRFDEEHDHEANVFHGESP